MPKITEYTSVSSLGSSDVLITDGTNGTKKISATDLAASLLNIISPINNRNIYRGKYLGSSLTEAQSAEIYNGTFKDMFIGDYWTIDGMDYVIADIDYFYSRGNVNTVHHLVLMPRFPMDFASMCETDEHGSYQWSAEEEFGSSRPSYLSTTMYATEMETIISTLESVFDDALMEMETTKVDAVYDSDHNGFPISSHNIVTKASLLSEPMVYGHNAYAMCNDSQSQSISDVHGIQLEPAVSGGYETFQLSIFKLNPSFAVCEIPVITDGQNTGLVRQVDWWLSDLINGPRVRFACVSGLGIPAYEDASEEIGVRPYFCIQGTDPNS